MASGRSHDRATTVLALPFGLLWGPALGWPGVVTAALSFLVGGLWLSPDLDTRSRATARWGPLALLWWPYRRLLSHRSLLSHSPLLGTAVRLGWLAALLLLGSALLAPLGSPSPAQLLGRARELAGTRAPLLLAALVGLEASTWLHLLQDGDPMPRLPRLLRRNRRPSVLPVRRRRPSRR
ncbi:MAG: metal-binding protein [Cyanobacteriota bacterium]